MKRKNVIININFEIETPNFTEKGAKKYAENYELPSGYVEDSFEFVKTINSDETIKDCMTTEEARDEFINLRKDDQDFANQYGPEDFNQWLNDYQIGLSN